MSDQLLKMVNIHKYFPGVHALDDACFELKAGEIHGLIGENGAGKSTLMNVLGGVHAADRGEIYIDGKKQTILSVQDAQRCGITFIHQELAVAPQMTVAENLFLGREPRDRFGMISQALLNKMAKQYLDSLDLKVSPATKLFKLSIGQQQMVEIAKALTMSAKIIVMDEPTSSLSQNEVEILFKTIRRLKAQGYGIVYISHKMSELFELTDRITVMRDAKYIVTLRTADTNIDALVSYMVGRTLTNYYVRTFNRTGEPLLEARNVSNGRRVFNCDFKLCRGEIVGFYGLIGSGRSELMQTIVGLDPMTSGSVVINGKSFTRINPRQAIDAGVALIPENRKEEGLIVRNTVMFNASLQVLNKFIGKLRVNSRKEKALVDQIIARLAIKTPSKKQIVRNLSGGNQQKVVLAKWLLTEPSIYIMDEPTRGIDVGAKAEIYTIMNELVRSGVGIVMISSELNEIINMSDRIYVMRDGRIMAELDRSQFDQETILQYALRGADLQ